MPRSKVSRTLRASYLYTDGTLVKWYEERRDGQRIGDSKVKIPNFASELKVYPDYESANGYQTNVEGRLIIGSAYDEKAAESLLKLFKGGKVRATVPSIKGGSENTKRLQIGVGYVNVDSKLGRFSWTVLDGLISGEFTIQTGHYNL